MDYIDQFILGCLEDKKRVAEEYRSNKRDFITVSSTSGVSLVSLLEEHLLKWRPWDVRAYLQFVDGFDYKSESSDLTNVLYKHLKLGVLGMEDRDGSSTLEVGIYLNKNIKKFEQYNKAVERSWDHVLDFDPKTGRVRNSGVSRGGYAAPLSAPSEYVVSSFDYKAFTGRLNIPAPEPSWGLRAVWRIDIEVEGSNFKVDHQVLVPGRRVLFKDTDFDSDLSELTSSMMHKVFGNTEFTGPVGDFGDGLRQLLAGEKSPVGSVSSFPTDFSDHRTWSKLVDYLMAFGKYSLLLGISYLFWNIYQDGWNISITKALLSVGIMVLGPVISAVLVPISEAMHDKARYKSIGM